MKTLSDKQRMAAQLLAAGRLCRAVAEQLQVSAETVSAWRRQPAFKAYWNSLRNEAHLAARDLLRTQSVAAAEALGKLIATASSEDVRRKAAVDVLTLMGHSDQQKFYAEVFSDSPDE